MTALLARAVAGAVISTALWRRGHRALTRDRVIAGRGEAVPEVPRGAPRPIDVMLVRADIDHPPAVVARTWLLLAGGVAVLGAAIRPALGLLGGALAIVAGPVTLVLARHRAERRAAAALPAALRLIASELRVGGTIDTALGTVAMSPNAIARDMARVRARLGLGASLDEALATWSRERPVAGVRAAAGALALARTVGGPAADAIDGLAASIGDRVAATAETRAQSAQARASALVMVVAPLGYLLFASTIDQRSLDVLLGTPFGRACLVVGIALDALAVLWIRFLVRPEPEV